MPDYIGQVEVPEIAPSGTFPITSDYGHGLEHEPQVVVHRFGSGNAKIEQRFYLGNGARRFTVRKARMREADRIALKNFWENHYGPYGAFTYNAPDDDGVGTTAYTCRFADEPLSWEFLSDQISSAGVTLIEIPSSPPTYTLNSTVTRFPSSGLQTALLSQVQKIIPLVKIQPRETGYPAIHVSDRRCTVGAQLYQARLLEFEGISQSIGNESDEAGFLFGNADRVMRELANDVGLARASLEFSLFHVGTGIKLDLWKGEVVRWDFDDGPAFRLTAADGIYELTLPYPTRRISRTCWKCFDDGNGCPFATQSSGMDYVHFPDADPDVCDKGYDTASGCLAHGMKRYFGGVLAEPQSIKIKDNSTGTWGFRRSMMTSVSLVSESIYDQMIPEIYTDTDMQVNCRLAAGREESDFYDALGIVGEGPLTFGDGHKLDGEYHHGHPGVAGLREVEGSDPAGAGEYFSLGQVGDADGDWRKAEVGDYVFRDNYAAGIAFLEMRRTDETGRQLSQVSDHEMQAVVRYGLYGWIWTGAGARTWQILTNPIWIAVNMMLRARGLRYANAATAEQYFDVVAAIAAAAICDESVTPMMDRERTIWIPEEEDPENPGEMIPGHWITEPVALEAQFRFRGILQEEKPLRDWIQEILMNCLGYYSFVFNKLKLGIRINSSVEEAFTEGNILLHSLKLASINPAFNHLTAYFADEEFEAATNSVLVYDIDNAKLIGGVAAPLYTKGQINLSGAATKSQAGRIVTTRLREELGGITEAQWKAGRELSLLTTVLALNVEPGMVCSMTHPDMPDGMLDGEPEPNYGEFRVTGWRLNRDYSIEITGRTTVDEMYDLTVGPRPADVQAPALPIELPSMPPRATGGKAIAGSGNASGDPTVTELLVQDDVNPDFYHRKIQVEFTPPPAEYNNVFSRRTLLGYISQDDEGGSIPGDQVVYVEVCPRKEDLDGIASEPVKITIPAGTSTNSFTIQCRLPAEATHYSVRIGPTVGRMYGLGSPIASPGTDWFEIVVTNISGLNSASLSPDPRYHHAHVFYYYDGSAENVRDGGKTSGPEDTELIFEPEAPESADANITVVVRSSNEDESDLFPFDDSPAAGAALTKDSGNPSGAANLDILTTIDDADIPPGMVVFECDPELVNASSIYRFDVWMSTALPAYGPYQAERDAHADEIIEGPYAVTILPGNRRVSVTRSASADVINGVLLIFTNDASPDSDLEGMVVQAQGTNYLDVDKAFAKAGAYTGYVITPNWTLLPFYRSFRIDEIGGVAAEKWRTPPAPCPIGTFYATAAARSKYGVGTRLTAGPFTFQAGGEAPDDVVPEDLLEEVVYAKDGAALSVVTVEVTYPATSIPAGVDVYWKRRDDTLGSLHLGTKLRESAADEDPNLSGVQNIGLLPPLPFAADSTIDVFYHALNSSGYGKAIEWLETETVKTLATEGGIDADPDTVLVEFSSITDLAAGDIVKIDTEYLVLVSVENVAGHWIWTVLRAQHGTAIASHAFGANCTKIVCSIPYNSKLLDGETDTLPQVPDVEALSGEKIIKLRWAHYATPQDRRVKHYNIYRGDTGNYDFAQLVAQVDTTFYVDMFATASDTRYYYWVRAVSNSGILGANLTSAVAAYQTGDEGVPDDLTIVVIAERQLNGATQYTWGVDFVGVQNAAGIEHVLVQIARDPSFADPIFDQTYGAFPVSGTWSTTELGTFFFRAKAENAFGWSDWSPTVAKTPGDTFIVPDTSYPGTVQNLTLEAADADPTASGLELVVTWNPPADGLNTLFHYGVMIHNNVTFPANTIHKAAAGGLQFHPGSDEFTDPNFDFTGQEGRYIFVYRGSYDADDHNLIMGDRIKEVVPGTDGHTVTLYTTSRYDHSDGTYQYAIVTPAWVQCIRPLVISPKSLGGPINMQESSFREIVSGLGPGTYYVKVRGVNAHGFGDYATAGPATIAGISADDLDEDVADAIDAAGGLIDTALPSVLQNVAVTGADGRFRATWEAPATGSNRLIDVVEQYDTVPTFNSGNLVTFTFGQWIADVKGTDPNKSYYFRMAARNNSGLESNATTKAIVNGIGRDGDTGWGPLCAAVGPIASGPLPTTALEEDTQDGITGAIAGLDTSGDLVRDVTTSKVVTNSILNANVTAAKVSVSHVSDLNADLGTITAGTIIGTTIKTAASGARIEFQGAGGIIYNSAGNPILYLAANANARFELSDVDCVGYLFLSSNICNATGQNIIDGPNKKFIGLGGVDTEGLVDAYLGFKVDGTEVISSSKVFTGPGGIACVTGSLELTVGHISVGDYINTQDSYHIDGSDVINASSCFVGLGGVDTVGDVKGASLYLGTSGGGYTQLTKADLDSLLALIGHVHGISLMTSFDEGHEHSVIGESGGPS